MNLLFVAAINTNAYNCTARTNSMDCSLWQFAGDILPCDELQRIVEVNGSHGNSLAGGKGNARVHVICHPSNEDTCVA